MLQPIPGFAPAPTAPRTAGRRLTVQVEPWRELSATVRAALGAEAERLAAVRGVRLEAVDVGG